MSAWYVFGLVFGVGLGSAITAMLVACLLPFFWAILAKKLGGFTIKDNAHPRAFLASLQGKAAKAHAVQVNSFESLPIFLASVLVAVYCFVPQVVINGYAWAYVALRLIYGLAYVCNWSALRSIVWALSLGCPLLLFFFSLKVLGAV